MDDTASTTERNELLRAYVEYCVASINAFLIAAKLMTGPDRWKLVPKRRAQFITATVINGFFVCLRRLAEASKLTTSERYQKALVGVDGFAFSKYKSSGWRALGDKLFEEFFRT